MRKQLIKRKQLGGVLGPLTDAAKNAIADTEEDTIASNLFGSSAAAKNVDNFSASNWTENFKPTPKASLLDKIKGFGQGALNSLGGVSGATNLASNMLGSIIGKPDINSGGFQAVDNVLGFAQNLPVIGQYASLLKFGMNTLNSLGAKKLKEVKDDQATADTIANTGGGYGGFMKDWDEASNLSGKSVGFFTGSSKYNRMIEKANADLAKVEKITNANTTNNLLTAQMGDVWNQRTMNDMNGGFGNISFGRLGLKVDILPKVHAILNTPKVVATLTEYEEETPLFKEGGKMNVIPEGSLHARLHHMENADGLTKKGIPVVSIQEGEQQAEIELNEIIFRLEVTKKIEKLMEDGSESAAIEAGKLLVKEIFENTDDRTGLIDTLKPEEKKQTTEDIVKNHQVFQQGGELPNLKSIEELVDLAIKQNPAFVQRIGDDMGYAEFTDEEGKTQRGTHLLNYAEDDGEYVVYPEIQMENGRLQYEKDWRKAFDKAKRAGNVIRFKDQSDAEKFTKEYKNSKQWKNYFDKWDQRYGSYKYGGIIEKLDTLSDEELQELRKYLKIEEA